MKDLCTKNKTFLKEIEKDTKIWKDILCSWIDRINRVKMAILPKAINRFHAVPIQILVAFFQRNGTKKFSNLYGTTKDSK